MLNSETNTYVQTQTDASDRKLGTLCSSIIIEHETLYSFINAILFYRNRSTSDCRKQKPPGSISLLLYNLLIMIVTGTNSVSFAKRQAYFLKENWDCTCHFAGKQLAFLTFETRLSRRILFWRKTLKIETCSGLKLQKSGPALDFWK